MRPQPPRARALVALAAVVALAIGVVPSAAAGETANEFRATIRRTSYGIPHITGDDHADIGFGFGYAHAEDNICTLADFYVTVNGQRSKYFGPDGSWRMHGNGSLNNNEASDYFYTGINASGIIEDLLAQDPPHGPVPEIREAVRGYVAGYNRYLEDIGGPDGISDPRCAGAEWVRPITEMDAYRRFYQLASLASAGVAIGEIGGASPPPPGGSSSSSTGSAPEISVEQQAAALRDAFAPGWLGVGSNAYGLGAEATDNGRGMVLGNPHFPWQEGERLYQWHATIPGVLDVAGASLYGVPVVLIGHTAGVAWSHTVSTAFRFTPFELTLAGPTTYLVDGEPREMEEVPVTIEVRTDDGSIEERSKSIWRTEYGWVTTGLLGLPVFPWTHAKAWALGDANEHMRYLNHFFEINHAQSTGDVERILKKYQGIPWVNTISADRDGKAYYADIGSIPNVPDSHAQTCNTALGQVLTAYIGLPVLDGARSTCAWLTDEDAVAPGIFGPENLPDLYRDDYVTNSNDSYWLTNPEEPLTGYAGIIGDEETARTLRTRLGLRIVIDRLAGDDEYTSIHPDRFTQDILQDAVFNNRQHAAELTRDAAVEMCRSFPGGHAPSASGPVAVEQDGANACDVLEGWDLRDDLDSVGALLFRRFWTHASGATPSPWVNGFDASDPVNTPNTLNTEHPEVQQAFGDAINDLLGADIPLDAPLGDFQYEDRDNEAMYGDTDVVGPIPIHGGPGALGVFNAINVAWDGNPSDGHAGYPDVDQGSSFVMVAHFVDGDCPVDADAIVTYSQSEDPHSPHFADQTRAYSEKRWNDMPFCEDEIAADVLDTTEIAQAAPTGGSGTGGEGAAGGGASGAPAGRLADTGGGLALAGLGLLGLAGLWGRRRR